MIPQTFNYTAPKNLDEALGLMAGGAKPLAGGMSLIPMMKLRLAAPDHLVDLGRLKELNYIREEGGAVHIGATTTHYDLENSALIRGKCPLLAEAAAQIGDVQVRNRGTVGGSVAHADPAADYPAALQAMEARLLLKGAKSERTIAVAEFFVDPFTTTLEPGEMVREIVVPIDDSGTGTSYQKLLQPASGFAIVGIAARIRKAGNKITMARIGVTGLSNCSYRATAAEKALEGTTGSESDVQIASALIAEGVEANSDLHASARYRRHLAEIYATRALTVALARSE